MGEFSVWHWLIVAAVFIALFGAGRLPGMARSIGQSLRVFKSEMRKMHDDEIPKQATPADPRAGDGPSQGPPATP